MVIILILSSPGAMYAMGGKEDGLALADKLIAEKKYNEAFLVAKEFMDANPEKWDEGQIRIQQIIKLREKYNIVADDLIDTIINNPENNELKLALIKQLSDLEKNPNKANADFIARTKVLALFTYNQKKYGDIMSAARAQLAASSFEEAIKTYRSGFVLYKPEFDEEPYDPAFSAKVNAGLKAIEDSSEAYSAAVAAFRVANSNFLKTAVGTDRTALETGMAAWLKESRALNVLRDRIAFEGREFERDIKTLALTTDSHFLPFAFRFTLGEKTAAKREGILGAIDIEWTAAFNAMKDILAARSEASMDELAAAFAKRDFTATAAAITAATKDASYLITFAAGASEYLRAEMIPVPTAYGKQVLASFMPAQSKAEAAIDAIRSYEASLSVVLEAAAEYGRFTELAKTLSAAASNASESARRYGENEKAFISRGKELSDAANGVKTKAKTLAASARSDWFSKDAGEFHDRLAVILDGESILLNRYLKESVTKAIAAEYLDHEKSAESGFTASANAQKLFEGVKQKTDDETVLVYKYPAESAKAIDKIETDTAALRAAITLRISIYSPKADATEYSNDLKAYLGKYAALRDNLDAMVKRNDIIREQALAQKQLADSYRLEAERRLEEARRQLKAENFDQARSFLARVQERYNLSLSLQEDTKLRGESDRTVAAFSKEIVEAEIKKVTEEVRILVKNAKTNYFGGKFDTAEENLLQAQGSWRKVFTQDDSEITLWLSTVRQAISIKTGRDIPETSTLYREMSQLMSQANRAYDEGNAFFAKGNKTAGLKSFAEAKKKIQEVKLVFPLNQEMSVLDMRIDQVIDKDAFKIAFDTKYKQALEKSKTTDKKKEAYTDLSVLFELDPKWPGLATSLKNLEYDLNPALRPPDPAKLAESNRLTALATRTVERGDTINYPVALVQLNKALELDPNNEKAAELKYKVQANVGERSVLVMSGADEESYQKALSLFQQGDKVLAESLVDQLWKKTANQKVPKLVELRSRIKASL